MDYLVRNFEYTEKPQVFEYYPQYYHKTDKVRSCILRALRFCQLLAHIDMLYILYDY